MQGRETYMMPGNLHLRTESHKEENEVEMIFINLESWRHGLQNSAFSRRFWRLGEFSFFSELLWLFLLKLMQCYIVTVEIQWSNRYLTSAHINNKYGNTALWYHDVCCLWSVFKGAWHRVEILLGVFFLWRGGNSQNLKQQKKLHRVGGRVPPKLPEKMFGSRNTNIISPFWSIFNLS